MTKTLIVLALILVPFVIHLSVMPLIPEVGETTRNPKNFLSLLLVMGIFLSALFNGEIKRFNNKWILIFLLYIPLSIQHSPPYIVQFANNNLGGLWQYQPFMLIFLYTLLIIIVSGLDFTKEEIIKGFHVISWVAYIMALYVIVQKLNIEQFFGVYSPSQIGHPTEPKLMGTMGNSALVSAFMVMCIPFLIHLKKWLKLGIVIIAVIVCKSQMAAGTMILCLIAYSLISCPKSRIYIGISAMLGILICTFLIAKHPDKAKALVNDNGRVALWKTIIKDLNEPPIVVPITDKMSAKQVAYYSIQNRKAYPLTGLGLGAFKTIYRDKHKKPVSNGVRYVGWEYPKWGQIHNEFLSVAYMLGYIGLALYLTALFYVFKTAILNLKDNPILLPLLLSAFSVMILSSAVFILQIEPPRIYTSIIVGLLLNGGILKCRKMKNLHPSTSI